MIQANEFRIGNYVSIPECAIIGKIKTIDTKMFAVENEDNDLDPSDVFDYISANGIPLTPEILEKCGFEDKSQTSDFYFEKNGFIIVGNCSKLYPSVHGESGIEPYGNELKYLHQLQNLYFALTGKELQVNL